MSNDIFADVFHGERGFIHALLQIFGENAILLRGDGARLRVLLARSNDVERKLDATGDTLFDLYRETGEAKYKKAMDVLVAQMKVHPRTL